MGLTWMNNGFICKDLYAPFVLDKDSDYHDDLKKKYKIVLKQVFYFKNGVATISSFTHEPKVIKF